MTNNGIVNIHGKEYMTVARRLEIAHEEKTLDRVETEVLSHDPVVVKATITVKGKVFTGISAVFSDSSKQIEKQNPYEVAETSAVGRALGFAGIGIIESVASADEVARAVKRQPSNFDNKTVKERTCLTCGKIAFEREGVAKNGNPYHGIFCTTEDKSHTIWL
jgi:hypothetical protein